MREMSDVQTATLPSGQKFLLCPSPWQPVGFPTPREPCYSCGSKLPAPTEPVCGRRVCWVLTRRENEKWMGCGDAGVTDGESEKGPGWLTDKVAWDVASPGDQACMRSKLLSCVRLFATPWTAACQAPLSMGFSRQEYWSGLPCPPPGDLPNPGIEPVSLMSPALAGGFFTTVQSGKPPGEQEAPRKESSRQ